MPGHLEKRHKSSWTIVIDLGRDPATGKRRRLVRGFKGTRREAEQELARLLVEYEQGALPEAGRMTVAEYLERWLEDARGRLAPRTFERYSQIVRLRAIPALGHIRLDKLRPLHLQEFYRNLVDGERKDGRPGGLSPASVLYHHRVLHRALEQAVRWQLIPRNPADAVEPPRARRLEIQALTEDQVRAMLEAAKGTRYYTLLLLAVATGMRRGELLALRWQDIDLEAGRITVCRSLQYTKERGVFFKEPKNPGSRRTVEISPPVVEALRRHRKEQAQQKLVLGPMYEDQDLVFEQGNGRPLFPDTITTWFPRFMERAGLPRIPFHALRHTHVTLLLKAGVPVKVVSDRVGHSGVRITLDTYSHVLPGMQKDAAAKLDSILFGNRAPVGHRFGRKGAPGNK